VILQQKYSVTLVKV